MPFFDFLSFKIFVIAGTSAEGPLPPELEAPFSFGIFAVALFLGISMITRSALTTVVLLWETGS